MSKNYHTNTRAAAVSGSFYPNNPVELRAVLNDYFQPYANQMADSNVCALIVPHAGYIFSGSVAAAGYAQLDPERQYKRIFLIGPAHRTYVGGASINYKVDFYETPLGNVAVDIETCKQLINSNSDFIYHPQGDVEEHSLEVQLPFLQYRLKHVPPIVPIVMSSEGVPALQRMAETLKPYFNSENLFVISSDFSHYTDYEKACRVDGRTGEAIENLDPRLFIEALVGNSKENDNKLVTSACGQSAILLLLLLINREKNIHVEHLVYKNSGDSKYGDKDQVVGYHAFAFTRDNISSENKSKNNSETFTLTKAEKLTLLHIARQSITNRLLKSDHPIYQNKEITPALRKECGAFVTLHKDGKLRGCIGHIIGDQPLCETIEEMSVAAAFRDPRFHPLQREELSRIEIEISVLTPLKLIHSIDEFTLGKDGIFIEKDGRSGTFLPQVANETGWSEEEFLGHCSRDKAGLGWNGWINANLYTYEAIVFNEADMS